LPKLMALLALSSLRCIVYLLLVSISFGDPVSPEVIRTVHDAFRLSSSYARLKSQGTAAGKKLRSAKRAARAAIRDFVSSLWTSARSNLATVQFAQQKLYELERTCYKENLLDILGELAAFYEMRAKNDPECMAEDQTKSPLQMRCFPRSVGVALDILHRAGELREMERIFGEAKQVKGSKGKPVLRWPNLMMRPPITLAGVRELPVWTRADSEQVADIMEILERGVSTFKTELQRLKRQGVFREAYAFAQGSWDRVGLFPAPDGSPHWADAVCKITPKTCAAFRNALPGRQRGLPYLQHNTEEVVFFHGSPFSHVLPHNGGSNCRINIHIGLEGYEDSKVVVHTNTTTALTLAWSDKTAMAFNDGWTHEVINGPGHRYVLAVAIMHPDIQEAHFAEAFNGRTDVVEFGRGKLAQYQKMGKKQQLPKEPLRKPHKVTTEL